MDHQKPDIMDTYKPSMDTRQHNNLQQDNTTDVDNSRDNAVSVDFSGTVHLSKGPQIELFRRWMRVNTNLLEGTIKIYARTISEYFDEYEDLSVNHINEFVSKAFRESRSPHKKYAFKPYMLFLELPQDKDGEPSMYKQIVKARVRPRKKQGHYLPKNKIKQIIDSIEDDVYRDIAKLQYACGARAHEIIKIKKDNIDIQDKYVTVTIEGKGDKEGTLYYSHAFIPIFEKHTKPNESYLFLSEADELSREDLQRKVDNIRRYYSTALRSAAEACGYPGFGTHDFRRNFTDGVLDKHGPISTQRALRHGHYQTTEKYINSKNTQARGVYLEFQEGIQ
ncbi:MAG: tyrosine-type recombinase/integrase [Petrotogales bacterium]